LPASNLAYGTKQKVSQQYFYVSHILRITCWGGRTVQAVACRAALYGFNSHPQLQTCTSVSQPNIISLKGTNTNPKKIDIHEIEKTFERTIKGLKTRTDIEEEDKTAIFQFVDHLLAKNMTKLRVVKYIYQMSVVARIAGKPLGSLDRKGMERVISQIDTARYSDNTKHDFKVAIRKYFQWLRGCNEEIGEFPDEVRWINPKNKKTRLLSEALVKGEELKQLVEAADNLRDKALILADYETGCRIGEILSCLIRDVTFDKYGAVLMVDGKTGPSLNWF
jgi:integrase/recombinase XerD